jgi:hypothetical protein
MCAALRVEFVPEARPARITADEVSRLPTVRRGMPSAGEPPALPLGFVTPQRPAPPAQPLDLPPVAEFGAALARALAEVLSGARPAPQVIRFVTPAVYSDLAHRAFVGARRQRRPRRAVVRRVRVSMLRDGVAELSVVLGADGGRVTALALRLEAVDGRWVITAFSAG